MSDEPEVPAALEYLISPKKEVTQSFVDYVLGLEDDSIELPAKCSPAIKLKMFKTRSGGNIKFCDTAGRGVEHGAPFTLDLLDENGNLMAQITV